MKVSNKKIIGIAIIIVLLIGIVINIKPKDKELATVSLKDTENHKDMFAFMLQNDQGTYDPSDTFPKENYKLNEEMSGCIDNQGKKIENALLYAGDNITINTTLTTYCYLYFDKDSGFKGTGLDLINSHPVNLSSGLTGGMYRYQGNAATVNNNYICFGTSDKTVCTTQPENYMYRIIGITSSGQLKLLKKEVLDIGQIEWDDDSYDNPTPFKESKAQSALNGNDYLNNTKYIPTNWKSKIAITTWKHGQIERYSGAGKVAYEGTGLDMYNYEITLNYSIDCEIGLMSLHDYALAYNNTRKWASDYDTTNWIFLGNNDSLSSNEEWLINHAYFGMQDPGYPEGPSIASLNFISLSYNLLATAEQATVYYIDNSGRIFEDMDGSRYIRPVFYLNATEQINSGNGLIDDPYILK